MLAKSASLHGICRFGYTIRNNRLTSSGVIICLLLTALIICTLVTEIVKFSLYESSYLLLENILNISDILVIVGMYASILYSNFGKVKMWKVIFDNLTTFDHFFSTRRMSHDIMVFKKYRLLLKLFLLHLTGPIFIITDMSASTYYKFFIPSNILLLLPSYVAIYYQIVVCIFIHEMANVLTTRYRQLKTLIYNLVQEDEALHIVPIRFTEVKMLYSLLYQSVNSFCCVFGMTILLIFVEMEIKILQTITDSLLIDVLGEVHILVELILYANFIVVSKFCYNFVKSDKILLSKILCQVFC